MKETEARNIINRLNVFYRLERRATDAVGWIAMAKGVSRLKAGRMIAEAERVLKLENAPFCSICRSLHGKEIEHAAE